MRDFDSRQDLFTLRLPGLVSVVDCSLLISGSNQIALLRCASAFTVSCSRILQ